jgi:uncharacterized protein
VDYPVPPWTLSNAVLHLILLPTEGCNFRCVYCYEDFRLSRMPREIVGGVKRFLTLRFPELLRLDVSWFGGEPLLAPDIVLDVLDHVGRLRGEHPEVAFSSDVTTNAYALDLALFDRLVELGVESFQITLDGTAARHDAKRRRADGRGTFDAIWSNLLAIRSSSTPGEIMLRLHVDRTNHEDMAALLQQCADAFGGDGRFSFFIRLLSRFGGPRDSALAVLGAEEGRARVGALERRARELGLVVRDRNAQEPICYAARPNSLVVRADGTLNKCTVAMRDPRNAVGALHPDGTLSVDGKAMLPWMRGLWTGRVEDLKCPLKGLETSAVADPPVVAAEMLG